MNALPVVAGDAHNCAFTNLRERIKDSFNIFGVNIHAFSRDNHVFLSAAVVQPAFRIDFAEITGV